VGRALAGLGTKAGDGRWLEDLHGRVTLATSRRSVCASHHVTSESRDAVEAPAGVGTMRFVDLAIVRYIWRRCVVLCTLARVTHARANMAADVLCTLHLMYN